MPRPRASRDAAVGPWIALQAGKAAWDDPSNLSTAAVASLRTLLNRAKYEISSRYVTDEELNYFLVKVFKGWKAGDPLDPPSTEGTRPRPTDKSLEIGELAHTAVAGFAESGVKPSDVAAPPTQKAHRQQGQPAYITVVAHAGPTNSIKFTDCRGGFLNCSQQYHWTKFNGDKTQAYLTLLRAFDNFNHKKRHTFNLKVVYYVARNRITYWANGNDRLTIPPTEQLSGVLMRVNLFRLRTLTRFNDEHQNRALDALKRDPEPHLFRSI